MEEEKPLQKIAIEEIDVYDYCPEAEGRVKSFIDFHSLKHVSKIEDKLKWLYGQAFMDGKNN